MSNWSGSVSRSFFAVQKRLYSEIELEDLQGESRERVIELDVQERQSFFETKGSAVQDDMQEFVSGKSTEVSRHGIRSAQ